MSSNIEATSQIQQQIPQESKDQVKLASSKLHSYTYWVDENNKSRVLPPEQRPQKIEPPKLTTKTSDDGRSNWNTVGTWEHRKINLEEIEKLFTQRLNLWISQNCPDAKLKTLSLKGQCEVIFTRNKKALTYEINGKVEFQKKHSQKKEQNNGEKAMQKNQSNISSVSEEDQRSEKVSLNKSSQKAAETKPILTQSKSSKFKVPTMTLEIIELTDQGDREFKSKADETVDKKFMTQKSENILFLLEEILKSFK